MVVEPRRKGPRMTRRRTLSAIALGIAAALVAIPALSFAQQTPPSPPAGIVHGKVNGANPGQAVIAFIISGNTATHCGTGEVLESDSDGIVYVVDLERDARISGCAAPGRQARIYFAPSGGGTGAFASQSVTIASGEFNTYELDVSLAASLGNRSIVPQLSANVGQ
jgi:hypothetical protein